MGGRSHDHYVSSPKGWASGTGVKLMSYGDLPDISPKTRRINRDEVVALRKEGRTIRELAGVFKCTRRRIEQILSEATGRPVNAYPRA